MEVLTRLKNNQVLLLILFVACILRFYKADFQSLWLDEILTMKDCDPKLSLKEFYDGIMYWEYIPHLYFFLLRILFEVFGYTTLVGRLFSAVIGVFGVYSIYLLGKEIYSRKVGLLAAAILTINGFHIYYSQDMRPYGMLLLFSVLAFYRMAIFIKNPSTRNAVFYGIFAGLIINAHFFGFITLFAQFLTLLLFLYKTQPDARKKFIISGMLAGLVAVIIMLPAYEAIVRVSEINSFWLSKPLPEAFTVMFSEFFSNSEMVSLIINLVVVFYAINLFKEQNSDFTKRGILANKNNFSFIILLFWITVSVIIPLVRSYLDTSMILIRYFINILPALILIIAIGLDMIRNKLAATTAIVLLIVFSLIDLMVIKNYYNTVTKSQFREVSAEIVKRNPEKIKVVAFWTWLFPYYLSDAKIPVDGLQKSLDEYVGGMKKGRIRSDAFWYADANGRPFQLTSDNQVFLNSNFILTEKIEYHDAWAHFYVPKNNIKILREELNLSHFKSANVDKNGNMTLFENTNLLSDPIDLSGGKYRIVISGNSFPAKAINGENAHLILKLNGKSIGECNLSEKINPAPSIISFTTPLIEKAIFEVIYDNDLFENGQDRNAILYSIKLEKNN